MSLPTISVVNFSAAAEDEVQRAVRAVNRQIVEDFLPIWGAGRTLRLYAPSFDAARTRHVAEEPIPGDGVLYLVNEASLAGALGYHDTNAAALPVGFVFVLDPNDWTVTLSHEALELIVDPNVNLLVPGPDPRKATRTVLHAYEVCDAVERTTYQIDGVTVSNFVTPAYFAAGNNKGTRNDFLGVGVSTFGVVPKSHMSFFDPRTWRFVTFTGEKPSKVKPLAERAHRCDHPKPQRPSEEKLRAVLEKHRAKSRSAGRAGARLRGITRAGRYAALETGTPPVDIS